MAGKIGALLASIPLALAASVLCFTWALIVALGLSTMRYTPNCELQEYDNRRIYLVHLLIHTCIFQQYEPNSMLILPSYLLPYSAASSGPVSTSSNSLNYALNALLSINMVVALLVAFILDNTVPGTKQERGVYIWSDSRRPEVDPASLKPYMLPEKISCWFRWAKCLSS
uniref:Nucleobase-ascorbate transporter 12 n=1 Tax=Ananas comosus var. bracteatus TaxID=296719 RepID=A0A6V7NIT3_ANACO|nr:unnamed protein product [Ananas comosus var. bracteatus]